MYRITIEIHDDGKDTTLKMTGDGETTECESRMVTRVTLAIHNMLAERSKEIGAEPPRTTMMKSKKQ